jgi:ParB family chromosome partitioning protein
MAGNKGLGRGYASLLGLNDVEELVKSTTATTETAGKEGAEIMLSIADIDPNYEQPRKIFDEDALAELAESIKIHGVIQPIVVTPIGKRFMIIAGERRFRASKLAGKTEIPAIVRNYTPQQIKEISLIENLQREDLSPIEAARAIKTLMTEFNMTQEVAADRIGKSRSAVANTLRLLTLSDDVIQLIEKGRLSAGHARTLVVVPTAEQYKLALKGCDNQMTVREMEKMVREYLNPKQKPQKVVEESRELRDLVGNMKRTFATKVSAVGNGTKGRIYIDYFTADDLDRICKLVEEWMSEKFRKDEE